MTVLDHVLECDIERLQLYAEQKKLTEQDTEGWEDEDKDEASKRLIEVNNRLELIEAHNAESKAINILTGLGFK